MQLALFFLLLEVNMRLNEMDSVNIYSILFLYQRNKTPGYFVWR